MVAPEEKMEMTEMIYKAIDSFIALYLNVDQEQTCYRDYSDICFKKDTLEKSLCNTIKSSGVMEEIDAELIKQKAAELYFLFKNEEAFISCANLYGEDERVVLEEFYMRCLWLINNLEEKIEVKLLEDIFIRREYFLYFGGDTDYPKEEREITKDLLVEALGQFGEKIMDAECFREIIMNIKSDFSSILIRRIQETETGYHQQYLGDGAIKAKVDDYIGQAYTIYNGVMYGDD